MNDRYGTFRGFVRLRLTQAELLLGRGGVETGPARDVHRLVFVCHGNICRSAFADVLAREAGMRAASFGLSTDQGKPAHGPAIAAAAAMGHDLSSHAACRAEDFAPEAGDLLLAMETRQLRRLAADPRLGTLPRTLLGLYTRPVTAHLHDPYSLSEGYMATCLKRIETAIPVLKAAFPGAVAPTS